MGQITRENGGWAVRGYSAAVAALRDPHLVVGRAGSPLSDRRVPSVEEFFGGWFTVTDAHAEIKGVLARAFSARRIAGFAAAVADLARVQVAGLPDDGDLVADCLTPFAVDCVSALAGIPAGAATRLVAVTRLLTAAIHGATREADEPLRKCVEYLRAVTVRVGATPLGDVLREVAGRFGTWTATAVLAQLLTAGVEPTTTGAALAYREIVRDPDLLVARPRGLAGSRPAHDVPGRVAETTKYVQYEAVAAPCQERRGQADTQPTPWVEPLDRWPLDRIADEALRCAPPFPRVHRIATRACHCLGVPVDRGEWVTIDIAAANRDLGDFNPGRETPGLSFGLGAYHCLGVAFARTQITAVVSALLEADLVPGDLVLRRGPHTTTATAFPYRLTAGVCRG